MALTTYQEILIFVMCVAVSFNILLKNWAVGLESPGSDGRKRKFDHPFVQCWFIFLGEILCLIVFKLIMGYCPTRRHMYVREMEDSNRRVFFRETTFTQEEVELIRGSQNFNPFLFFPPAILCMIATPVMYVGISYSPSFQALLGPSIVLVAMLSRRPFKLLPICFMMIGLSIFGLGNVLGSKDDHKDINGLITGILLILIAQIITTFQIVYEENYLVDKDIPPLQAVGWEGIFGFVVLSVLMIPFYFIKVGYPFAENSRGVLEDFPDAMAQIQNNLSLLILCVGIVITAAFSNFAAISLTKEISAMSRVIINITFCLCFQEFHFPQWIGMFIFWMGLLTYFSYIRELSDAPYVSEESSISETPSESQDNDALRN